ncbi:hypothetical protein, partial [[Eubacterium] cellulosolvens]
MATEETKVRKGTSTITTTASNQRRAHARGVCVGAGLMIEIDTKEFRGDRDLLAKILLERLKVQMRVERNRLRIGNGDKA